MPSDLGLDAVEADGASESARRSLELDLLSPTHTGLTCLSLWPDYKVGLIIRPSPVGLQQTLN